MEKIKAIVLSDTPVLIPNLEHKNLTQTEEIIKGGTEVIGNKKEVHGLRRGEPFTYKLFVVHTEDPEDNKLIFFNKIKPMDTVDVKLGADAAQSPTVVNMKPAEKTHKNEFVGAIVGGIAGFLYCRYKKHDLKKTALYIAGGAALGFGVGYLIEKRHKVTIQPSK